MDVARAVGDGLGDQQVDDDIFLVSRDGMTIRFHEDDVRAMGRAAAGVR
ncbi:MAG TPA: DNA gyrase C-terminal beta-propeller domain-containing protein, partial [Acidimicrobiia bacterium]